MFSGLIGCILPYINASLSQYAKMNFLKFDHSVKVLNVIFLLVLLSFHCVRAQKDSILDYQKNNIEDITADVLKDYLENNPYPSASVAVVLGDSIILSQGYGWQDKGLSTEVNSNTPFNVASVSKVFVAIAMMQLIESGKVNLDDPVNKYLNEFKIGTDKVTIRNLLTHTSGLDVMLNDTQLPEEPLMSMASYFKNNISEVVFEPGDQINYSNHGMALAGHLVEIVSGLDFSAYVEKNILEPLGMDMSTFEQPIPESIAGEFGKQRFDQQEWVIPYPSASLVSTANDMSEFMKLLLSEKESPVLSRNAVDKILSRQFSPLQDMPGIGLSFFESDLNGYQVFYHTGSKDHFAILALIPELKLGIYMAMSGDHGGSQLRQTLVERIISECFPKKRADKEFDHMYNAIRSDTHGTNDYIGDYRFNLIPQKSIGKLNGLISDMTIEEGSNGHLIADKSYEIRMFKKDLFRTSNGAYIYFRRNDKGQVKNMFINSPLRDSVSLVKLEWWEKSEVHIILFLFAACTVFISLISFLIIGIGKIYQKRNLFKSSGEKWLWRYYILSVLAFVIIPITGVVMVYTSEYRSTYRLNHIISIVQIEILIAMFLGAVSILLLYVLWKNGYWSKWSRIVYTLFCSGILLLFWSLEYWSVLAY